MPGRLMDFFLSFRVYKFGFGVVVASSPTPVDISSVELVKTSSIFFLFLLP